MSQSRRRNYSFKDHSQPRLNIFLKDHENRIKKRSKRDSSKEVFKLPTSDNSFSSNKGKKVEIEKRNSLSMNPQRKAIIQKTVQSRTRGRRPNINPILRKESEEDQEELLRNSVNRAVIQSIHIEDQAKEMFRESSIVTVIEDNIRNEGTNSTYSEDQDFETLRSDNYKPEIDKADALGQENTCEQLILKESLSKEIKGNALLKSNSIRQESCRSEPRKRNLNNRNSDQFRNATSSALQSNAFNNSSENDIFGTIKLPMTEKYNQLLSQVHDCKQKTQKLPGLQVNSKDEDLNASSKLIIQAERSPGIQAIKTFHDYQAVKPTAERAGTGRRIPINSESWEDNQFDSK